MDKDKHIKIEPTKDELDKLIDQEFDFEDIVGHRVEFSILGSKSDDGTWTIDAEADFAMSLNGMDWASVTVPVSTYDADYDSALATAMMGVAGGLNNRELLARIRYMLNQQKLDKDGIIKEDDRKLM
jgi:hypothetical protein